jgi:hypothetical protein
MIGPTGSLVCAKRSKARRCEQVRRGRDVGRPAQGTQTARDWRDGRQTERLPDGFFRSLPRWSPKALAIPGRPREIRRSCVGWKSCISPARAIADYAATAGLRRKENSKEHGNQAGDPVRAAKAIIEAVQANEPPFRLALGRDANERIKAELDAQLLELDAWKQLALDADFPTG